MIRQSKATQILFSEEQPSLIFEPAQVFETTEPGHDVRGEITIRAKGAGAFHAQITSDHLRIVTARERIHGNEVVLQFGVDVRGLADGDDVAGNIILQSSAGEMMIPVQVAVRQAYPRGATGEIRNLDDLLVLAKQHPEEAYRLFLDARIAQIMPPELRASYESFCAQPLSPARMEAFFVACEKKEPLRFSLPAERVSFEDVTADRQETMRLEKNTWGQFSLRVYAEGDFLSPVKQEITGADFVGSVCQLPYLISAEQLHGGRNVGAILIDTGRELLRYRVIVHRPVYEVDMQRVQMRNDDKLMRLYLSYELDQITQQAYIAQSLTLLAAMRELGDYQTRYALYEAYLQELAGKRYEVRLLLQQMAAQDFRGESPEAKAGFLYLGNVTAYLDPEKTNVVERVREFQRHYDDHAILLWMLFRLDPDILRAPEKRMAYLEEAYLKGARSPLLFTEALPVLRRDVSVLRRMGPYTRALLRFLLKYELITEELARRVAYLSDNEKKFTDTVYRFLAKAYEKYPTKEILSAICKLLMKGAPHKQAYFHWYEEAVQADVSLTRLYEQYAESLPENWQRPLPAQIRKYFSLSGDLSAEKQAQVYANIIRFREEDGETYRACREMIVDFAKRSLGEGRIDDNFALVYEDAITEPMDEETARALAPILFSVRVVTDDPAMREVIVRHKELAEETVTLLVHGVAYVSCYTEDAHILFGDGQGGRYEKDVIYAKTTLFSPERYLPAMRTYEIREPGYLLYEMQHHGGARIPTGLLASCRAITESAAFTESYRSDARKQLFEYFATHTDDEMMDRYLKRIDVLQVAKTEKKELTEALIDRGFYEQAYACIEEFGIEEIAPEKLAILVSWRVEETEAAENEYLLGLCAACFRLGKYDERILTYLNRYYDGSLTTMLAIRKQATAFLIPTRVMDERILGKAMFTDSRPEGMDEVLAQYAEEGGTQAISDHYALYIAERTFLTEEAMGEAVMARLAEAVDRGEEMPDIARLSLLYALSRKKTRSLHEEVLVDQLLADCVAKGYLFSFFRDLPDAALREHQLEDRVFVEHRAPQGDRVFMHYTRIYADGRETARRTEELTEVIGGVFIRSFLLFYGEKIAYTLSIDHEGERTETARKVLTADIREENGRSRYQMLNRMLQAKQAGRTEDLRQLVTSYKTAEKMIDLLFTEEVSS